MGNLNNVKTFERRFLVDDLPFDLNEYPFLDIEQGYLNTDPEIRVRRCNQKYTLTVKSCEGLEKNENEQEILAASFKELFNNIRSNVILKRRYQVTYDNFDIIIDDYQGQFKGLRIAKVNFVNEIEALNFNKPKWFLEEVTNDSFYKSKTLALLTRKEISKKKIKSLK